ncbi:MAG TPA: hypothetical protein VLF63_00605, partial [Patescibacteria group bacterium]|nr:hypothetical protein [Patescibacteria group bacterium]
AEFKPSPILNLLTIWLTELAPQNITAFESQFLVEFIDIFCALTKENLNKKKVNIVIRVKIKSQDFLMQYDVLTANSKITPTPKIIFLTY